MTFMSAEVSGCCKIDPVEKEREVTVKTAADKLGRSDFVIFCS